MEPAIVFLFKGGENEKMENIKIEMSSRERAERMPIKVILLDTYLPAHKVTLIRKQMLDVKTGKPIHDGIYELDLGNGKIISEDEVKTIQIVFQKKKEIFNAFTKKKSIEFKTEQ